MSKTVIYTDGGCRHLDNTYTTGYGVYVESSDIGSVEIAGSHGTGTNNTAELDAYIRALEFIIEHNCNDITIYLDSRYVILSTQNYLEEWLRTDFIRKSGKVVANKEYFIKIHELQEVLRNRGISYKLEWVQGHSGNKGNEHADKLATRGLQHGITGEDEYIGYITSTVHTPDVPKVRDIDPLISPMFYGNRMLYLCNNPNRLDGYYFTVRMTDKEGNKKEEAQRGRFIGCPSAYTYVSVVRIKTTKDIVVPTIEKLQDACVDSTIPLPCLIYLDKISNKRIYNEIYRQGTSCLGIDRGTLSLWYQDRITELMSPAYFSLKTYKHYEELSYLLNKLDRLDDNYTRVDITDKFKEPTGNKYKLHSDIDSATKYITVPITLGDKNVKVKLTLTVDIPERNKLARIFKDRDSTIALIIEDLGDMYKVITYITTNEGDMICMSPWSCIRVK